MAKKRVEQEELDGIKNFQTADGKTHNLTLKEQRFCEAYLAFFGNGTEAVMEAGYKVRNRLVATSIASENLRKPHIIAYIDSLLEEYGFNDDHVEKQHLFVLNQYDDLKAKNKAIEMFYKLKGKFAPENHVVKVENLTDLIASKLGTSKPTHNQDTE